MIKNRTILFRANSSSDIGTGHIMRDLVLAKKYKYNRVIFATEELEGNINHKIREDNYDIEILKSNSIDELDRLIKRLDIDMIIIDNYDIDYNYEKKLKSLNPKLTIMVLDDTYEKHYCDILLNHNISANKSRYRDLVPKHCEIRCGREYRLIRDEFKRERNIKTLFISIGGSDHSQIIHLILSALSKFLNLNIHVVTLSANINLDELKRYISFRENITLHIDSDKIAKLMRQSDFAVVTPSVILNEIDYMNIPFIVIKTAENQNDMFNYLKEKREFILDGFNRDLFKKYIDLMIIKLDTTLINFIDLSISEKEKVLEWRNHRDIRQWMLNRDIISLDEHLNYIDSLKVLRDRVYFLVRYKGEDIGVIDFTNIDFTNNRADFGLFVRPDSRGRGFGNILIKLIIDYAFNRLKVVELIAEVFPKNRVAIRLYEKFNFKKRSLKDRDNENMLYYIYKKD